MIKYWKKKLSIKNSVKSKRIFQEWKQNKDVFRLKQNKKKAESTDIRRSKLQEVLKEVGQVEGKYWMEACIFKKK